MHILHQFVEKYALDEAQSFSYCAELGLGNAPSSSPNNNNELHPPSTILIHHSRGPLATN